MNGDGLRDVLIGSFSGTPQCILKTKEGFSEPTPVLDKNGDVVAIAKYWDFKAEDWSDGNPTAGGLCTSVAAVDWDDDGDLDLLLGGYNDGTLFVRLNEGSATETQFATKNQPVMVNGQPIALKSGVGAPRITDWDGDGLFDVLIGTIYGEVVLLHNMGSKGEPAFLEIATLIEPLPGKAGSKKIKRVPAKDDGPIAPGSSFHIEPVDYDGDGDLDLLVGARSEWLTGPVREPTEADFARAKKLSAESTAAYRASQELKKSISDENAPESQSSMKEYRALLAKYRALRSEAHAVTADPIERGDFIWLFRRR